MILTEAEARTKWCPHARCADETTGAYNVWGTDGFVTCIASDCMFWRWYDRASTKHGGGYCGSAGTPHTP